MRFPDLLNDVARQRDVLKLHEADLAAVLAKCQDLHTRLASLHQRVSVLEDLVSRETE